MVISGITFILLREVLGEGSSTRVSLPELGAVLEFLCIIIAVENFGQHKGVF